jgi:hypothetical protein
MSGYNPYQHCQPAYPPALQQPSFAHAWSTHTPGSRPQVWWFYVAYCAFMSLLYAATTVGGVFMLAFAPELARADESAPPGQWMMMALMLIGMGVPLAAAYAAAPLLPKRKWAWIYGIIAIGIGLTSACTLPAAIPLLIFWLKDDTKFFYGVQAPAYYR